MAISPAQFSAYGDEVRRIFEEAETRILETIARRLKRGIDKPGWADAKLREIQAIRAEIAKELGTVYGNEDAIRAAIERAYDSGAADGAKELERITATMKAGIPGTPITITEDVALSASMTRINQPAVDALVKRTLAGLNQTRMRVMTVAETTYSNAVYHAERAVSSGAGQVLTGTLTRRQASQTVLDRLADRGISGFIDTKGRAWSLSTYAEMSVRTASTQAAIDGHQNRLMAGGYDLVIVLGHADSCEICEPWEDKILSLTGRTPGYPTLDDARADGLYHVNCTHSVSAYIEGMTDIPEHEYNPQAYEDREQQRYLERGIRMWKNRSAVALDDQAKIQADAKVQQWQVRAREHVKETGVKRDYSREQIGKAH